VQLFITSDGSPPFTDFGIEATMMTHRLISQLCPSFMVGVGDMALRCGEYVRCVRACTGGATLAFAKDCTIKYDPLNATASVEACMERSLRTASGALLTHLRANNHLHALAR
jgi:hypothetical protein